MKKQKSPPPTCKQPERSCKPPIKKHSCSEHSTTRTDTDERPMSCRKSGRSIEKSFCPCNPCSCDYCPDVFQLLNRPISKKGIGSISEDLTFGLCPKSPDAKPAGCSKTCTEAEKRKPIKLDMVTYDDECTCELIARAIRADVHRYLSLVDRTQKDKPKSEFKDCPECMAKCIPNPKPKLNSVFKDCPECIAASIPKSKPKSKIKFCDSDISHLSPCLQPDEKL